MKVPEHLSDEKLVLYLDGELDEPLFVAARQHVTQCDVCRSKLEMFGRVSSNFGSLVENAPLPAMAAPLAAKMKPAVWKLGMPLALAASLAVAVLIIPITHTTLPHSGVNTGEAASQPVAAEELEVNGEQFVALPYSNPDLPLSASQIVEMQVPVASLASAGLTVLPSQLDSTGEATVDANVLVGMDGQPRGIHVLDSE